jgi:hypothetical protein
MIVWDVLRKIVDRCDKEFPDKSEKWRSDLALAIYRDLEDKVLNGPSSPVGATGISHFYNGVDVKFPDLKPETDPDYIAKP